MIAKNPSGGVLGFITNHGYLDNPTFRGMRWHLLKTFDKIWVLDLHGNSKRKEVSPDGSPDKNVFDIMQGVAIIIAVRKGAGSDDLAEVWHGDLWGSRKAKNGSLYTRSLTDVYGNQPSRSKPEFLFVTRDETRAASYDRNFAIQDFYGESVTGVQTSRDHLVVDPSRQILIERLNDFSDKNRTTEDARIEFFPYKRNSKYSRGDTRGWSVRDARTYLQSINTSDVIQPYDYRPLDRQFLAYDPELVDWPRTKVMSNFDRANLGLALGRQGQAVGSMAWNLVLAHEAISDLNFFYRGGGMSFPLYLYPDEQSLDQSVRLNLEPKLYAAICAAAGIDAKDTAMVRGGDKAPSTASRREQDNLSPGQTAAVHSPGKSAEELFDFRAATGDARPSEVKVFDYIYGVLHSPEYRATYAEFLKIDFPRVPYPASPEVFAAVSAKGEALRRLHLMEDAAIGEAPFVYLGDGDDMVAAGYPKFESGKVHINADQYFDGVPETGWNFHIGGYQPAQKWLKDRRGRSLSFDDISHYQKIIKILIETDRIMGEIELPLE